MGLSFRHYTTGPWHGPDIGARSPVDHTWSRLAPVSGAVAMDKYGEHLSAACPAGFAPPPRAEPGHRIADATPAQAWRSPA